MLRDSDWLEGKLCGGRNILRHNTAVTTKQTNRALVSPRCRPLPSALPYILPFARQANNFHTSLRGDKQAVSSKRITDYGVKSLAGVKVKNCFLRQHDAFIMNVAIQMNNGRMFRPLHYLLVSLRRRIQGQTLTKLSPDWILVISSHTSGRYLQVSDAGAFSILKSRERSVKITLMFVRWLET